LIAINDVAFCEVFLMKHIKSSRLNLYLQLIRWDRPAGWLLLLWPTLGALWVAAGGFPGWHLLTVFVLGTILMRSAGCCINDVADREFDRHVKRTAQRPVTTGVVSVKEALGVGAVLALMALGLVLTTNVMTLMLSFVALFVTLAYPYTKRLIAMPQAVLGVAFGMGIPMAFSAVHRELTALTWVLMLGNLFWVLAYDTEYAMVDRDDDLKIGIKTSAITLGQWDVPVVMMCYFFYIGFWALALMQYAKGALFWIAIGVTWVQVLWHYSLIRGRSQEGCFRAFRLNHWLGLTMLLGIVLGC
jgi:4-hydroxybenzoate polyprenyltransferase